MQVTIASAAPLCVTFQLEGWKGSVGDDEPSVALQLLLEPFAMMRDNVADALDLDDDEAAARFAGLDHRTELDRVERLFDAHVAAFCLEAERVVAAARLDATGRLSVELRDPRFASHLEAGWSWESAAFAVAAPFYFARGADRRSVALAAGASLVLWFSDAGAPPRREVRTFADAYAAVLACDAELAALAAAGFERASPSEQGGFNVACVAAAPAETHADAPTAPSAWFRMVVIDRQDDRLRLRYEWLDPRAALPFDPVAVWHLGIGALIEPAASEPIWATACRHVRGLSLKEATGAELDFSGHALMPTGDGAASVELSLRVHDASVLERVEDGTGRDIAPCDLGSGPWRLGGTEQGKPVEVEVALSLDLQIRTTHANGTSKVKTEKVSKPLDGALARARVVRELFAKGFRAVA